MLNQKTIAVVIPAYNEESQIATVVRTMPTFVDRIIIINDVSKDKTAEVVLELMNSHKWDKEFDIKIPPIPAETPYNRADIVVAMQNLKEIDLFTPSEVIENEHSKIILINHLSNGGVGAGIASGYKWCKDRHIDCTAVMAGDAQMDPAELESICMPVVLDEVDYCKGNRLIHQSAWLMVPRIRFFGNSILSILTKVASGYWHVSDTQTGYTAISHHGLNSIALYKIFKRYGMPNDMLVKLNISFCTVKEVMIKPVYAVGEQSKLKVPKVVLPISMLLFRSFFKRLWIKYLFRDFHPLFLLYHLAFLLGLIAIPYSVKIANLIIHDTDANPVTILAFIFLVLSSLMSFLFAMWMDMQDNERLYKS
jgi:glycosyltransferase involved in cell wall biosynthesis